MKCFFIILTVFGAVFCDSEGANKIKNELNKLEVPSLDNLPNLPINSTKLPNEADVKEVLKKKCDKIGGPDAFGKVELATEEVQECMQKLINTTVLQEEIEKAKKTGELDVVFEKYCKKVPIFKQCVTNYTDTIDLCLEQKEKESKKIFLNVTESLTNFVCHKNGDRIAVFIAEGGPDCINSKQEQIQACANKTLGKHIPAEVPTLETLPILVLDTEECQDMKKLQECIVTELQTCKDPTPANIVDSLFKFIFKVTPCGELLKPQVSTRSIGIPITVTVSLIVSAFISTCFV